MLSRVLLACGLLMIAGCAVGERPVLTDDAIAEDGDDGGFDGGAVAATVATQPGTVADDTDGAASLDDLTALGDAPPVLVTPTGVIVPVLGRADDGYLVRTPCGNDAELLWGQPLAPVDVVLDPGHGGSEQGALGPSGQAESEVNLDLSRRTAALLEAQGYRVALTRTADYRITIPNRAAIADRLEPSMLISLHHNSPTPAIADDRSAPGTEVYAKVSSEESRRLGGLVYGAVVDALAEFDAEWASRTDAGVLNVLNDSGEDAYGIVRRPAVPTVLVELAYLSNPTEAVLIGTAEYRQAASAALAAAVVEFLESAEPGRGFVDEPRLFNPSGDTGGSDGCVDPALQ